MDESWRVPMGLVVLPRRAHPPVATLDPDDFLDVFGGPPLTILLRHHHRNPRRSHSHVAPPAPADPNSPEMRRRRWPSTEDGFYDDIFGSASLTSQSLRPRSTSISECPTPMQRPRYVEDPTLAAFASKLRPIAIPPRRNGSPSAMGTPAAGAGDISCANTTQADEKWANRYLPSGSSTATVDVGAGSFLAMPDGGYDSSSIDGGSFSPSTIPPRRWSKAHQRALEELKREVVVEMEDDEEEEEAHIFYTFQRKQMSKTTRETESTLAIEEAITWAREKFVISTKMENANANVNMSIRELNSNKIMEEERGRKLTCMLGEKVMIDHCGLCS